MLAQAARGPLLLILVGMLFALQQAGRLPISRSWPLLIIGIGVMKLVERMLLGPPAPAMPGAGPQTQLTYGYAPPAGQAGRRPPFQTPPPPPGGAQ